jgi:hypothetical protein
MIEFILGITFLGAAALTLALFTMYLAYCTLRVARDNGKLRAAPWPVQIVCYALLAVALVCDVLFNVLIGSLIFVEFPDLRRPTFTHRCKKHMNDADGGWRMRLGRWVCDGWLNPFEAGHC